MRSPSGENVTEVTGPPSLARVNATCWFATHQKRMVPSQLVETSVLSSGAKANPKTSAGGIRAKNAAQREGDVEEAADGTHRPLRSKHRRASAVQAECQARWRGEGTEKVQGERRGGNVDGGEPRAPPAVGLALQYSLR